MPASANGASSARSLRSVLETRYPTIIREKTAMTKVTHAKPAQVGPVLVTLIVGEIH